MDISDEDVLILLDIFPNLRHSPWKATSSKAVTYNCIGWAMQEARNWWPIYYYWPPGVAREETVEACRQAFETRGFETCPGAQFEPGFLKVAIYASGGELTHAARQLPDGKWTSKLGDLEDIEHDTPEALECEEYGKPVLIMRKASTA